MGVILDWMFVRYLIPRILKKKLCSLKEIFREVVGNFLENKKSSQYQVIVTKLLKCYKKLGC